DAASCAHVTCRRVTCAAQRERQILLAQRRIDWNRPPPPSPGVCVTTPSASVHVPDSVSNAEATPEKEQPYGALGLKDDEYARIKEILGRRPTSGELAMYSVMWSEHCSYKRDRKSTRLNSSHVKISYAVFCLKKKIMR